MRAMTSNIRGINDRFNVVYALLSDERRDYHRRIYGGNNNSKSMQGKSGMLLGS